MILELEMSLMLTKYRVLDLDHNLIVSDSVSCSGLKTDGEKMNRIFCELVELGNMYQFDYVVIGVLGNVVKSTEKVLRMARIIFNDSVLVET